MATALRSELRTLRNQSRDEATLRNQLNLEKQQCWSTSDSGASARKPSAKPVLKDWLMNSSKKPASPNSNSRFPTGRTEYATDDASHPSRYLRHHGNRNDRLLCLKCIRMVIIHQ